MTPDISIIISVFNVENYLGATLESILLQDHESLEVVIVDDHSTDGTRKLAERYAALDGRFLVFTNEGMKGAGGARNTAMRHMRGKTCFFLDGDDLLFPGALSCLYALVKESGAPVVRGIGAKFCQQRWLFFADPLIRQESTVRHLPAGYPATGFCHHLYNSDFLRENSIIFPEDLPIGQDGPFICHAYSLLETVPFINRKIFLYRINHKQGIATGVKSISAINYFLLAREHFAAAGKRELVAPYLECKFSSQWLERAHAALEDSMETALLFMEKCALLLHDMEEEVRPFLDGQLGAAADEFWRHCRTGNAEGMLSALKNLPGFKPQSLYMGIDGPLQGPKWQWFRISRRLANLVRSPETSSILLYLRKLQKRSAARLAAHGASSRSNSLYPV